MYEGNEIPTPVTNLMFPPPIVRWNTIFTAIIFMAGFGLVVAAAVRAAMACYVGIDVWTTAFQLIICTIPTAVGLVCFIGELRKSWS